MHIRAVSSLCKAAGGEGARETAFAGISRCLRHVPSLHSNARKHLNDIFQTLLGASLQGHTLAKINVLKTLLARKELLLAKGPAC